MPRRVTTEILTLAGSGVLFGLAFAASLWLVYPLLSQLLQRGGCGPRLLFGISEYEAWVFSSSLGLAMVAAVARVWTRHVLGLSVLGGVVFVIGMILLGQVVYLVDHGTPSGMWAEISPGMPEYLGGLWCAGTVALGWHAGGFALRREHHSA